MSFDSNNKRDAANDSLEMESYAVLEAGVYRARLEAIHTLDTKFGEALQFNWRVIGGDSDGETFWTRQQKIDAKIEVGDVGKSALGAQRVS